MNSLGNRQRLTDIEYHQDRAELIRDYSVYDYTQPQIKPVAPTFSKREQWVEDFENRYRHLGHRQVGMMIWEEEMRRKRL